MGMDITHVINCLPRVQHKMKKIINTFTEYKERLAILGIGILGNWLIVYGFNFFLYPYIIWKFGVLKGGIVMTFLSFLICYGTIRFYDWSKRDWLGIEAIKELKTYGGNKKVGRLTAWIMKKSDPVVFLFLSIKFDPFIVTAYMRRGKFDGMNKRDWKIFMGSLFLGNTYWTLACYTGITLFEWGWKAMVG